MIIEVRPIERERYHGLSKDKSIRRSIKLSAVVDTVSRKFLVDITEKRLIELGKILGLDLNTKYQEGKESFYDSVQGLVKLEPFTMVFNTEVPMDELRVGIIKKLPEVAPNAQEAMASSEFTHYIYSEDEELERSASKTEKMMEAVSMVNDMSQDTKVAVLLLVTGKDYKTKSNTIVNSALMAEIEKSAKKVMEYAKMPANYLVTEALVKRAIDLNVISKDGPQYEFRGNSIGFDTHEIVKMLLEDKNQPLKVKLLDEVSKL